VVPFYFVIHNLMLVQAVVYALEHILPGRDGPEAADE